MNIRYVTVKARILIQVTIYMYRMLRIGGGGHLDQSEAS